MFATKRITRWTICLSFLFGCSSSALAIDLEDQTALVEAYLHASSDERNLAMAIAKKAHERASSASDASIIDTGLMVKLWCESTAIAPDPRNLLECARYRLKAVEQMSNPEPSREAVQLKRAQAALVMIRAALEIAGGDPGIHSNLRLRLKSSAECLRNFISGASTKIDCDEWS
jgi:hypothetical protein